MQNFDQGKFNYHQVQFVVDALLSMNENPLVILPMKYTRKHFHVFTDGISNVQRLGPKEQTILDE